MIILSLLLLLSPALRAEESFERSAETAIRSDWRKELARSYAYDPAAPPSVSSGPDAGLERIVLSYTLEIEKDRWRDLATMTMTRRTFDRYQERLRRWELDAPLRRRNDEDPSRYLGSFGGRDAAAVLDVVFTSLADDPRVAGHPWLETPATFLVETMRLFDRLDNATFLDVFGFEVNDFISDRFGLGRGPAVGPALGSSGGSSDGGFHGRLRIGVSGVERVATKFDGDPLKVKAKYEISCPRGFALDRIEVGAEVRPFCRDDRDSLRVYIGGRKSF